MTENQFVYKSRTQRQIKRRIKMQKWPQYIFSAYHKKTKNLCSYLRSEDFTLDMDQRRQLADLIAFRLQKKTGRGRRAGVIPEFSELEGHLTNRRAERIIRQRLAEKRKRSGGRLSKEVSERVIEDVCRSFADAGYNVEVNEVQLYDDLHRGRRRLPLKSRKTAKRSDPPLGD